MAWIRSVRVATKLNLIIGLALIALIAAQSYSLWELQDELLASRRQALQELTDTAYSLIDEASKQEPQLGRAQAQQLALKNIRGLRYGDKGYFWIHDRQLHLVLHPMKPEQEGQDVSQVRDASGKLHWQEMARVTQAQGAGFVAYTYQGPQFNQPQDKLSYVKEFKPWGWTVGTGLYIEDIHGIFWREATRAILVLLMAAVLVIVITRTISRSITQPLRLLTAAMQRTADGDLTPQLHWQGKDELCQLTTDFNTLIHTQQQMVSHIQQASQQLAATSQELAVSTEQTQEGMQRQFAEIDSLATAMNQMTQTVHDVALHASSAASTTDEAKHQCDEGQRAVEASIDGIQQLAGNVTNTAAHIEQLQERCNGIGAILDVIRTISEQTNLLALNAAIEAARAGEQGRGFAVVADEVRNLANRTRASTVDIQDMIAQLQQLATESVQGMLQGREQAEQSVNRAQHGGQALTGIVSNMQHIYDREVQIATAAEQQTAVSDEMNRSLHQIRDVSAETSAGAEGLARSSEELAAMAQALQDRLAFFRLSPAQDISR
ncbi:methyl-accepting chemotaxis protein [Pokkaliibacter plantistimulans]|uniref:Methyl-accepting chemotaxis protein n=1 Tax=Proteobacteria bacterium 228 TaxID=2083153 RepID=A0A2S5KM89_9PROT|nr:methyl-accepting chemotaxis protein [Pokkaliibacter plantistimulans]PPC75773.1 methyl-accepting chemotaxis protein [Pokkaliibacter plantistimulans]